MSIDKQSILLKVKGLVIRSVDLSDNDKLITLLTEEYGKITAIANGSRSLKSRYMAAVQPFCYGGYVLYKTGDKYYVREIDLKDNFFDIHSDLARSSFAVYMCDILYDVSTETIPDTEMLRLALNTLYVCAYKKSISCRIIKAAFEIKAASILGFMPDVTYCSECGKNSTSYTFDIMNGCIVCPECSSKPVNSDKSGYFEYEDGGEVVLRPICLISEAVRSAMNYVINAPIERFLSFSLVDEEIDSFSSSAEIYLLNHLERGFKSLDYYKDMLRIFGEKSE